MKPRACTLTIPIAAALLFVLAAAGETATILAPEGLLSELRDLEQELPGLLLQSFPKDMSDPIMQECDAMVGHVTQELLEAAPECRWVQVLSAGVDHTYTLPGLQREDIVLTNAKIIMGPEIADHAMALLLGLTRNLPFYIRQMDEGAWKRTGGELPMIELRGKTMLVIGLGGIGMQVAERAHAAGMTVHALDPKDIPLIGAVAKVGKPDELLDFLPEADVVVCCAPRTPDTEGILDAEAVGRMKEGSYFINVSRGAVADTDALVQALEDGRLAGAGLDVTEPEPLPADHPLWRMPNVIITPHVAGLSAGMEARRLELVRENIRRFVQGKPLRNTVDTALGY